MEYTQDERLAVLTAMQKQIKPALDEAKAIARQEIMDGFAETHTDRRAIIVGEEKVGEIGISYSKAAPVILKERMDEAVAFLDSIGMVDIVPKKGWEAHFAKAGDKVVCTDTGEMVDWAMWCPKSPKTAAVRGCDPEDVMQALGPRVEGMSAAALLGDGELCWPKRCPWSRWRNRMCSTRPRCSPSCSRRRRPRWSTRPRVRRARRDTRRTRTPRLTWS